MYSVHTQAHAVCLCLKLFVSLKIWELIHVLALAVPLLIVFLLLLCSIRVVYFVTLLTADFSTTPAKHILNTRLHTQTSLTKAASLYFRTLALPLSVSLKKYSRCTNSSLLLLLFSNFVQQLIVLRAFFNCLLSWSHGTVVNGKQVFVFVYL